MRTPALGTREQRCWFDVFDWPLTWEERQADRFKPQAEEEHSNFPSESLQLAAVGLRLVDGFLCPPDRPDLAWVRRRKSIWAWRKYRKARRWACALAAIPFIRMIAIGNALGYGNCREESDIDLVIVTAPRRVWLVRLLVTGVLRLFRQRPGEHCRDALCPSFFLTTEAMRLDGLQQHTGERSDLPPDPYLLWWVMQLTVLLDRDRTYHAFWRANEQWVRRWLPHARPRAAHPRLDTDAWFAQGIARLLERVLGGVRGDAVERWARRFQERQFPSELRALINVDSRVIVNDAMLKFHIDDRRAEFRRAWIERLAKYA